MRTSIAAAVAALALAAAPAAAAHPWSWGPAWLGPGVASGPCIWYWSQSACSHWSTWRLALAHKYVGGEALLGFENNARIRGIYVTENRSHSVWNDDLGMHGWLLAHVTSWSPTGAAVYVKADAYS